jgi:hypothetical protein
MVTSWHQGDPAHLGSSQHLDVSLLNSEQQIERSLEGFGVAGNLSSCFLYAPLVPSCVVLPVSYHMQYIPVNHGFKHLIG